MRIRVEGRDMPSPFLAGPVGVVAYGRPYGAKFKIVKCYHDQRNAIKLKVFYYHIQHNSFKINDSIQAQDREMLSRSTKMRSSSSLCNLSHSTQFIQDQRWMRCQQTTPTCQQTTPTCQQTTSQVAQAYF